MKNTYFFYLVSILVAISSCSKSGDTSRLQCDKIQSREMANELMSKISEDRYETLSEVQENIIGEWGSIGLVPGWVGFVADAACIRLSIDENTIELTDENTGEFIRYTYEITRHESAFSDFTTFRLNTDEDLWSSRTAMKTFSEQYMFGAGADDGPTYVYEKL